MSDGPYFADITRMPNLSEREILRRLEIFVLPSGSAEATWVTAGPHAGGRPLFATEGNVIYPARFFAAYQHS